MREILFRGKRYSDGEWVEGSLLAWPDGSTEMCYDNPESDDESLKSIVYPETVGQYTGLTDKNGKKIFEGDVLSYDFVGEGFVTGEADIPQRDIFVVTWRDGKWDGWQMWERMTDHEREALGFCDGDSINSKECRKMEVIGNIHDNPEFLEVPHE